MRNSTLESHFNKRISYILNTKNRANRLKDTLNSYREYKNPDDELIVIDGASTDNTENVLKEFSDIIDAYISEPDKNGNEATNKGMLLSKGKYIKQIGTDDIFYKEALNKAYKVMEENTDIDLLVCGGIREFNGSKTNVYIQPSSKFGVSVDDYFQNREKYPLSGCGLLIRRSLLSTVGLFETDRPFSDLGFILRSIYMKKNVKFCRINMFYHKIHDDSVTRNDLNKYNLESISLLKRYCSNNFKREYFRQKSFSYQILKRFYKMLVFLYNKFFTRAHNQIEEKKKDPQWDGGFS
jgi:glycosyltransferase involved in cell wall biosynthesis